MDARTFLVEFGHIASAPGGVQRLRELVLELAIHGDLVYSSTEAESTRELLKAIQVYRDQLESSGKLRRQHPLPEIAASELSFRIPETWVFERLGNICEIVRGVTFSASQKHGLPSAGLVPCLRTSNVQSEVDWQDLIYIDSKLVGREDQWVSDGDILISMANSFELVGKVALVRTVKQQTTFGGFIAAVRPHVVASEYLYLVLRSPYMQAQMRKSSSQTTNIANISLGGMRPIPVPIPPLGIQKRIVIKVDELMVLCDRLEVHQQAKKNLSLKTRTVVLDALGKAKDSASLRRAWSRTSDNWRDLLDDEQGQDFLKRAVSSLAVRGLISGWSSERPHIEEIKADCAELKHRYIRDGWLRRQKPIGVARSASAAYPPHWAVVPFDEVAVVIGGVTKGRDLKGRNTRFFPYLRVANVQRGFFDLDEMKQIEILVDEFDKYRVETGDLLITEGGDWDKVGRTAIWKGGVPECLHQNHVFKARIPSGLLTAEWIELVFNSAIGRDYFAGASKQTTNLASINMSQLRSFPFPVPPLPEQLDILAKVTALTATCTALKERWSDAKQVARDLATASVRSITGIRVEERETMKIPKTELVSRLSLGVSPADKDQAPLAALLMRSKGELAAKALWQASGLEIDEFYRQLKTEMAHGWIVQPEVAYVREVAAG